jgi:DNA-binding CsgD family transcriptional regulator
VFISEATVKTHPLHAYEKLGVNDRAAAYERGLPDAFETGLTVSPC